MSRVLGIIPARWASTRFPGKMLTPLCGKPLLLWVWEQACEVAIFDELLVATDDPRIEDVVTAAGGRVVMTRPDHPSGTDRIAEAAAHSEADVVVNIQGDEPLIDPALITRTAEALCGSPDWDMATAAVPIEDPAERDDPSVVKVVWDGAGGALYFSRSVIPHVREADDPAALGTVWWRHVGLYGYRRDFLDRLVRTPPTRLEQLEKLEQLRALHLGGRIRVLETTGTGPGVDKPQDVPVAEEALRKAGRA